ncbi:helix-turn-helix domain-containing protein [Streptomyces sp. NPDC002537]
MTVPHCAGPVGDIVRRNVRRLRAERRLTTERLAEHLRQHTGRSIPASGITRLEGGQRRVDVDDLVALATVLGVTPAQLLEPPTDCAACRGTPPPGFACRTCGAKA